MFRYRTEIVVPPDRYVWLKLPDAAPLGPARVSVVFGDPAEPDAPRSDPGEFDPDREDIEWWDEFEDDEAPGD